MSAQEQVLLDNHLHSVRAELHQRSDVNVIGSKVDARTEAMARSRKDLDNAAKRLRELFSDYDKAQKDLAGVGVEAKCRMDAPLAAAYGAWLTENGGRAEGPGEVPLPTIHENNA